MLADTPQTPEQWAEFIAEAETQQAIQEQRMNQIINGSYSDAEKQAAVHDYMLQSDYLLWVKSKYAEYSQTGVLPADMTYSCNLSGNVYRYFKEGSTTEYEYKLLELGIPPYADTNEHEIAHMQPAEVRTFDLIKSPDLTLQLKVTAGSWADPIINYKYYTGNYPGFSIFTDNYQRTTFEILASGRWATDASYSPSSSTDGNRNYYKIGYAWSSGFTWIPTWGPWRSAFWGPKSYTPSGSDNTDGIVAQQVASVQKSGTVDTPWDFYNDSILPDVDSDDAFFPDGYHIADPHDPSIDPDLPDEDEGNPPSTQDTKIITSPSWFITQYILNQTLLESLGKTLWSSWLDSNSNVWENFLFDYFQQTGTFNITAALDYIISLRVYPFDLHAIINPTPPQGFYGQSDGVYMGTGRTNFTYSSGVTSVKTINSVSGYLYMGDCEVKTDYPYSDFRDLYNTTIQCYLPYCGMVELNPVDVWGKTLSCHYYIDFQSGGCTAIVKCPTGNGQHTFPVASKSGQIGFTIPLTATNAGQLAAQFIGDATRAVGTIAGMGFSIGGTVSSMLQGNVNTADASMGIGQSVVGGGLSLANQAVNMLSRPGVNMPMLSGGSGCESLMMYPTPFITIRRGRYAKPENFPHSVAFANATSGRIGDYKGMNCFTGVDASGLTCHSDEKDEIIRLLESGVYLPE